MDDARGSVGTALAVMARAASIWAPGKKVRTQVSRTQGG